MNIEQATKNQLLTIALHEDCSMGFKYESCRELQLRAWHDDMLQELVVLWGKGYTVVEIAIELGIEEYHVQNRLKKYGLYSKRQSGIKRERVS